MSQRFCYCKGDAAAAGNSNTQTNLIKLLKLNLQRVNTLNERLACLMDLELPALANPSGELMSCCNEYCSHALI